MGCNVAIATYLFYLSKPTANFSCQLGAEPESELILRCDSISSIVRYRLYQRLVTYTVVCWSNFTNLKSNGENTVF